MLNILLPLDGSELAERAVPHAYAMASSTSSRVTLLRVVIPTEFRHEDAFSRVDWRLRKQQALSYLKDVAEIFEADNIPHELLVEEGFPAEVIVDTVRTLGIQLLVMSTHGRGAAVDFPHGGVASKVLSAITASVCLVGARKARAREPVTGYKRLLVPIDGSHESECALRVAFTLAESLAAELIVVCISETPEVPPILVSDERAGALCRQLADLTRLAADRKLAELKARVPEKIVLRTSVMLTDRLSNPIIEATNRFHPDLLVASMTMIDRVNRPYTLAAQIASAVDEVPLLVLSPKGIGDAFCEPRSTEAEDVRTADVS